MVILLVDDNIGVQFYVWKLLKDAGFTVLTADGGRAALEASRNYPGAIDLLLSDVDMPRMDGLELYRHIAAQRPEIKVLLMSGDFLATVQVAKKGFALPTKAVHAYGPAEVYRSIAGSIPA